MQMNPLISLDGVAAPFMLANLDTDQIIPKQFMKIVKRVDLSAALFFEHRFDEQGNSRPEFVLNQPEYDQTEILITGDNFGCGSSREHAVWAVLDFGIRCIISTSFSDIFFENAVRNGLLCAKASPQDLERLSKLTASKSHSRLIITLADQIIFHPGSGQRFAFIVPGHAKELLLSGENELDLVLKCEDEIRAFADQRFSTSPWTRPDWPTNNLEDGR